MIVLMILGLVLQLTCVCSSAHLAEASSYTVMQRESSKSCIDPPPPWCSFDVSRAASDWIAGSQQLVSFSFIPTVFFSMRRGTWASAPEWADSVLFLSFLCDQRQKNGFTSPVRAVNYTAPVWTLRHTPGSRLIWAPAHEWALVSSWGWWKLLI